MLESSDQSYYLELASRSDRNPEGGFHFESVALPHGSVENVVKELDDLVTMITDTLLTKPWAAYFVAFILRKYALKKHARKYHVADGTCVIALDIDHVTLSEVNERMKKLPLQPNSYTLSGGGVHLYYRFAVLIPTELAELLMRYLGALVEADHTHDCTRLLRMPGTVNSKYTPPVQTTWEVLHEEPYLVEDLAPVLDAAVADMPSSAVADVSPVEFVGTLISDKEREQLVSGLPYRFRTLVQTGKDPEPRYRTDLSRSANVFVAVRFMTRQQWQPDQMLAVLADPNNAISAKLFEVERQPGSGGAKEYLAKAIRNARAQVGNRAVISGKGHGRMERLLKLWGWLCENPKRMRRAFRSRITMKLAITALEEVLSKISSLYDQLDKLPAETEENRDAVEFERAAILSELRVLEQNALTFLSLLPFSYISRALENMSARSGLRGKQVPLKILDWKYEHAWYEHAPFRGLDSVKNEVLALYDDFGSTLRAHALRRQQCTAQLMDRYLASRGRFLYTPTGVNDYNRPFPASAVFYRDVEKRVIMLDSEDFDKMLETALMVRNKADRGVIVSHIASRYREFTQARVGFISQFNPNTFAIYLDAGEGNLMRITADASPELVPNGTDNVFLRPQVAKWCYKHGHRGQFIDLLTKASVDTGSSQLTLQETRFALKTWIVANFLRGLVNHYTLLTLVGQKGSGKTSLAENIGRFILGNPDYTSEQAPRESRDFVTACVHKGIFVLDNVEELPKWEFKDYLARLFNRGTISQRSLYSDATLFQFKTDSFVILTAMDPSWGRDDVADRSLVVPVRPWFETFKADEGSQDEYQQSIMDHRDEIYTEIVDSIQNLLRLLRDKPLSKFRIPHRLESYAMVVNAWAEANNEPIDTQKFWAAFRGQQANITQDVSGITEFLVEFLEHHHQTLASAWAVKHPGETYSFEFEMSPTGLHRHLSDFHGAAYFTQIKSAGMLTKRMNANRTVLDAMGIRISSRTLHGLNRWSINYFKWAARNLLVVNDGVTPQPTTASKELDDSVGDVSEVLFGNRE